MELDIKSINEEISKVGDTVKSSVEKVKSDLSAEVENKVKASTESINANVDAKVKSMEDALSERISSAKVIAEKAAEEVEAMKQKEATRGMGGRSGEKTFNENLSDTIKEIAPQLKSLRKEDKISVQMKAVGDMSYTSNFPTGAALTNQVVGNVFQTPQENIWLSDILPNMRTDSASVTYPKHTGGEGGAAIWESGSKPKIDFDFAAATAHVKWIAGIVKVPREMLDDLDFLNQFIQAEMLRSLKIAENDFILNGSTGTNPVDGLIDVAQSYNGTFTVPVDRLVDAAWGQIVENDFNPTHFILQPRDTVKIGLNKATGSGEYDLPVGTVGFNGGRLNIAGLNTISTKLMTANNFLAIDRNAAMFVRRMNPELRVFEQNVNDVETNMITFRVEERVTLLTPYGKAFVKGLLTPA